MKSHLRNILLLRTKSTNCAFASQARYFSHTLHCVQVTRQSVIQNQLIKFKKYLYSHEISIITLNYYKYNINKKITIPYNEFYYDFFKLFIKFKSRFKEFKLLFKLTKVQIL